MTAAPPLTDASIREFVESWYVALDRHVPLAEVLPRLVDDGLVFAVPEKTFLGHRGFTEWYDVVTRRFFDEVHTVTKVEPILADGQVTVRVLVNWQAKIWNPPADKSQWLGFDADQSWIVVADGNELKIQSYVVTRLDPMPGSASL